MVVFGCFIYFIFLNKIEFSRKDYMDIFKDISNLEAYKENGIDLCYFFISTDHSHYVNQKQFEAF